MPNKRSLVFALILLLIAAASWADVRGYYKTTWTGGGADALDGIDDDLPDGVIAIVYGTIDSYAVTSAYKWDDDSTATESGITNIAQDSNGANPGRWIQHQPAYCFGTVEPTITDGVVWFDTSQ